ncbi:MAG: YfcE family phosphodiesterase [Clostridia bacterium]|nr:YfcE family phosphodiesterase [Clostridia bacterium]
MKCLCFSDSHGFSYYMKQALLMHPDAEVVFFLGDGTSDAESIFLTDRARQWICVRGNCDFRSYTQAGEIKKLESIALMGKKIVLTHGDLYGAKYGSDGLLRLAENTGADIVLFGHTHSPFEKYFSTERGGVYLFNPGSIGSSYGASSYGVIMLTEDGVLFSHGKIV